MAAVSVGTTQVPAGHDESRKTFAQRLRRISQNYLFRVVVSGIITIWAVTTFTFVLIRQMPGNPVDVKIDELMTRQSLT